MKKYYALGSIGAILIGLAVFANKLGLDNDIGWGRKRIILAVLGCLLLLINIFVLKFHIQLLKFMEYLAVLKNKYDQLDRSTRLVFFALAANIVVIGSYFWMAQPSFNDPAAKFNYYSRMAIGFKNGQLSLMEKPPADLLALTNPYDYNLRDQLGVFDFPWDVSLYKGRFYFYWGPTPSLLLAALPSALITKIYDKHLAFLFACGLFIYISLFAKKIWGTGNQGPPAWFLGISLLAAGLSAPATLMLKEARVYEVAIFAGQFFFIAGLYWVYTSFRGEGQDHLRLLFGGLHWAMALASRLTTWPAILFCAIATFFFILKDWKIPSVKKAVASSSPIWLSLLLGVIGLGWYNLTRFDSIVEFGLRYQLANVDYNKFTNPFSTTYIKQNLYNYFVYPFMVQKAFPYFTAIENSFSNERMTGLIYTSACILFAFTPAFRALYFNGAKKNPPWNPSGVFLPTTLVISLLIMLFSMLAFYFPAARYAEDFMPLFFLTTFFVIANEYDLIKNVRLQRIFLYVFTVIGAWSIAISSLLALHPQHIVDIIHAVKLIYQWLGLG